MTRKRDIQYARDLLEELAEELRKLIEQMQRTADCVERLAEEFQIEG